MILWTQIIHIIAKFCDQLQLIFLESVLSAVSRVFRDDWKKSIELSTNIVYIFFCLSTFSQFHAIIAHYKVYRQDQLHSVTARNIAFYVCDIVQT